MTLQRIPPAFNENLTGDVSNIATLSLSSGSHWLVRVRKNPGMYLEDGWSQFIKDNKLGDDEFLVFRYDGDMHFHVKIFDKSGVKRSSAPKSEEKRSEKRARGRPRKHPIVPVLSNGESSERFTSGFPFFASHMTKICLRKSYLLVGDLLHPTLHKALLLSKWVKTI